MKAWSWLPVIVRAIISGSFVLIVGGLLSGPLIFANIKFYPSVPWSVPLLAMYMWFFWQYFGGRWLPASTAEARREGLRARPLSSRVWRWAVIFGVLVTACNFAAHWVVARLTPLRYVVPEPIKDLPPLTLFAMLLMLSVVAGIVEEAAFRGYMQGPIERRHGVVVAIAIVAIIFGAAHLTDAQPQMTFARMFFIVTAAILYGILVHVTDSIVPGVVFHAAGDAVGITWIWWLSRQPRTPRPIGWTAASNDPQFWLNCIEVAAFGIGAIWAFRNLRRAAVPAAVAGPHGPATTAGNVTSL